MRETRETERILERHLQQPRVPHDEERDARLLAAAIARMARVSPGKAIGVRRTPILAAAGALIVLLAVVVVTRPGHPAWALELAVQALQRYTACHLTLTIPDGAVFDCWARADPSGEESGPIVMRGANGAVIWFHDGKTYYYDPRAGRVEVDDAKTAGFAPWLGAEWFRTIAKAKDARTVFGTDPATGRSRVTMTGGMTTAIGPISWSVEFDRETRLPIAYTQWDNLRRSGPPSSMISSITYYEELPDSTFEAELPEGVAFAQKPIVLPEANLALLDQLGGPADGMRVEGMTRAQAARTILERVYQASMAGDLEQVRRLCPLTQTWSDEMMRALIVPEEEPKRLARVVSIGPICRQGSTRLGPFVVLPTRLETRGGKVWDEKQIVLFRQLDGGESCVLYGPYGMPCEVE